LAMSFFGKMVKARRINLPSCFFCLPTEP